MKICNTAITILWQCKRLLQILTWRILRWYWTPPCCDALIIKINTKINYNFIYSFLPKFVFYAWAKTEIEVKSKGSPRLGFSGFLEIKFSSLFYFIFFLDGVYNFSPLEMATLMTALPVLNVPRQPMASWYEKLMLNSLTLILVSPFFPFYRST